MQTYTPLSFDRAAKGIKANADRPEELNRNLETNNVVSILE